MITPAQLVAEARRWVGVPYVHQGRSFNGVDCIGLIICVRSALAPWPASTLEPRNYARHPRDGLLLDRIRAHCAQISGAENGAVILIQWPTAEEPSHAAIYADGNLIHAYQRAGAVVETGYRAHWPRYTHSFWRLPDVSQ